MKLQRKRSLPPLTPHGSPSITKLSTEDSLNVMPATFVMTCLLLSIRVMDDLKFKRDPTLGTGSLDLEETLDLRSPKEVTIPLKSNGNNAGTITFLLTSYDKALPHARVITPAMKSRATEESSEEEEEEVVQDLRTSTIMTTSNSFTCQLLDYTPPDNAKLKRPYIITTCGKDKLRTEHLFHNQTAWRETVVEYPYQNYKTLS